MTGERKQELEALCKKFRNDLIDLLHGIQTGHPRNRSTERPRDIRAVRCPALKF